MATTQELCRLTELSGWNNQFLQQVTGKKCTKRLQQLTAAQYLTLYNMTDAYKSLEDVLRNSVIDFQPPKKWSNLTRKAQKMVDSNNGTLLLMTPADPACKSSSNITIGPNCNKIGLTVESLNSCGKSLLDESVVTIGVFTELCKYKEKIGFTWDDVRDWLTKLTPSVGINTHKVRKLYKKSCTITRDLSRNKDENLQNFKDLPFHKFVNHSTKMKPYTVTDKHSLQQDIYIKNLIRTGRKVLHENQTLTQQLEGINTENQVLHQELKNLRKANHQTETELNYVKRKAEKLEKVSKENRVLKQNLTEMKASLKSIRKQNYYKRLKRKEKKLQEQGRRNLHNILKAKNKLNIATEEKRQMQIKVRDMENSHSALKLNVKKSLKKKTNKINYLKNSNANLQISVADTKQELKRMTNTNNELARENELLQGQYMDINDNNETPIKTKEGKRYSDKVRCCVMDLQSKDVPTNKIKEVISTVTENLLDKKLELPSRSTIQNILDEGLCMARAQLCEEIGESQNWGLFSDGTSRDGRKILDIGVNTREKTLSLGFKPIAKENAASVCDVLKTTIEEITEFSNSDKDETTDKFLKSLTSLMSDRSSVMKKTNQLIEEWRNEILTQSLPENEIPKLNFLYCGAHVLLGFHSKSEAILKEFQKQFGDIGRDKLKEFNHFKSNKEPAGIRLVRTASEVFGPRGDEKNGARQEWLAYTREKKINSKIISYRGNRFNNLYSGAVAVLHHQKDIVDFLSNYVSDPNLKLKSVLADLSCDHVISEVRALAILSTVVTEPFWDLMNSAEHHLDLHRFVKPLQTQLEIWAADGSELLSHTCKSVWDKYPHTEIQEDSFLIGNLTEDSKQETKFWVEKLCNGMKLVVEKQLHDHLEGGVYGSEADIETKEKTAHTKLTNLQAENLFGELDFAMTKKRNATLRHHSATVMLKRNHTLQWLKKKSKLEQKKLLQAARKKYKLVRLKEQKLEKDVKLSKQQILMEIKAKKIEAAVKKEMQVSKINNYVKKTGGVCRSKKEIDRLLANARTIKAKKEILKNHILYCKLILKKTADKKLFCLTETVVKLRENLTKLLDLTDETKIVMGMWVAVAYEKDRWYPGEVTKVEENNILVNFMHPIPGQKSQKVKNQIVKFNWPQKRDEQIIDQKFIIMENIEIVPTPGLRYWVIANEDAIQEEYINYCQTYFGV